MKKILLMFLPMALILSVMSCNDRLEGDEILDVTAVKIDSVKIAQYTMDVYSTQTIKTYSNYTSKCEGFYGYDYIHSGSLEREVISYKFKSDAACGDMVTKVSQINFQPQKVGIYQFKFYTGKDAAGENTYQIENIDVR